jgi:hypothetical protein
MGTPHISKVCPPAYKVFFAGAREDYMPFNESICDWSRPSKAAAVRRSSMLCR